MKLHIFGDFFGLFYPLSFYFILICLLIIYENNLLSLICAFGRKKKLNHTNKDNFKNSEKWTPKVLFQLDNY